MIHYLFVHHIKTMFYQNEIEGHLLAKKELIDICDIVYDIEFKVEIESFMKLHRDRFNEFLEKTENRYILTIYKKISNKCLKYLQVCLSDDGILLLIKYNFIKSLNNQWDTTK